MKLVVLLVIVFLLFLYRPCDAELIHLVDGNVVHGRILGYDANGIEVYDFNTTGTVRWRWHHISYLDRVRLRRLLGL